MTHSFDIIQKVTYPVSIVNNITLKHVVLFFLFMIEKLHFYTKTLPLLNESVIPSTTNNEIQISFLITNNCMVLSRHTLSKQ